MAKKTNSEAEKKRRDGQTLKLQKCSKQNPFIAAFNSANLNVRKKLPKHKQLRLIKTFYKIAKTDEFKNYLMNLHPEDKILLGILNSKRHEFNLSIFFSDGTTEILYAYDDTFAEFGYEQSQVIGKRFTDLLVPKDGLQQFNDKLLEVKRKLMSRVNSQRNELSNEKIRQNFEISCQLLHKSRNKNDIQHRSTVKLSGSMVFYEKIASCEIERKPQGNHHIVYQRRESIKSANEIPSDDQFWLFAEIEIVTDIFRHSIFTTEWKEYVLFMDLTGKILWSDQRIFCILGYQTQDVVGKLAHDFILPQDSLLALYNHKELLENRMKTHTSIQRLLKSNGEIVFILSYGVLYEEKNQLIFKLTAKLISDSEGKAILNQQLSLLPSQMNALKLQHEVQALAMKITYSSSNVKTIDEPSIEQLDQSSTSSFVSGISSNSNISYPQIAQPFTTQSSLSTTSPHLLISSVSHLYNHNGQSNKNDSLFKFNQTEPVPMSNALIFGCHQATPVHNHQQIYNLTHSLSSNPQLTNKPSSINSPVFIQNISVNNFIIYNNNNQQQLYGDQHLPTDGEGAFVNLLPYLENDNSPNDLNQTSAK